MDKKIVIIASLILITLILVSCAKQDININETAIKLEQKTNITPIITEKSDEVTPSKVENNTKTVSVLSADTKKSEEKTSNATNARNDSAITTKNGCSESDGGFNEKLRGHIIDSQRKRFDDNCKNQKLLIEYSCSVVGFKEEKEISCPYGCLDGACDEQKLYETCIDSDYKDYYNKGNVTYMNITYHDYCRSNNYLKEQVCSEIGLPGEEEEYCKDDCKDGACINIINDPKSGCLDSDLGKDALLIKGKVIDPNGQAYDYCMNTYTVVEYRCNNVGFRTKSSFFCPKDTKCIDGACVNTTNSF